jgi:sugar phosphate isomerase/epimerase
MEPKIPIAAITDEYTADLEKSLEPIVATGMTGVELRVLWGKNIMDLGQDDLARARDIIGAKGLKVVSIASPLLKCVLPNSPPVDERVQHDVFASKHTFEDQPPLAERAFSIAKFFDCKIIRVFSYWRTVEPKKCFDGVVKGLAELAGKAGKEGLIVGIENEHACNVATATETAAVLGAVADPALQVVWDPANSLCAGEEPFPYGFNLLPVNRIAHVHAKDCHIENRKPVWGPLGTRSVDWKGQVAALLAAGYKGYISLETHWPGPGGDKFQASVICGWNLRGLAAA